MAEIPNRLMRMILIVSRVDSSQFNSCYMCRYTMYSQLNPPLLYSLLPSNFTDESDTDEDDYESSYGGSHRGGGKAYGDAGTLATEDFDDDDTLARQKKALKKKKAEEKAARDPSKAAKLLSKLAGMRGIVIIVISFMSPFKIVRKLGEVFFEGDIEPPSGDAALAADACNAAAEHFDDPAVAEEMDRLLEENPDNLDEIVENDETLRNLRNSDPIAAELMRDPETFKVITDGDNLRAMGELTQAMEGDFVNGLDGGGGADAAANAMDALDAADAVGNAADAADVAGDAEDAFETTADYEEPDLDEEDDEEGGAAEDAEEYLQDAEMEDYDMKKTSRRGQRGKGKNQRNRAGEAAQGAKGILGAGISAVAGGFLGDAMGDVMDFGGGEDLAGVAGEGMGGLEDVAADTVRDNVCLMCMFFSGKNQNCNATSMPVFLFHIYFLCPQTGPRRRNRCSRSCPGCRRGACHRRTHGHGRRWRGRCGSRCCRWCLRHVTRW